MMSQGKAVVVLCITWAAGVNSCVGSALAAIEIVVSSQLLPSHSRGDTAEATGSAEAG